MSYVDPNILDKFNRNALPTEELRKIEFELLKNGVANASLSTLLQEYESRTDISELIGEDEEVDNDFQIAEKIFDENFKKNDIPASVETNIKIHHNMNNMKVTNDDMVKVAERCKAISAAHESSKGLAENLISAYMQNHPEASAEDANEIVAKLMKGCEELTQKYNRAIAEGFNAEAEIISITSGMDAETRFNYLINALSAVDALNVSTFASQKDVNEAINTAIAKYAASTPTPTDADCDTIQKLLIEAISNNTLLLSGMEKAQELLASAKEANTVINFASAQYDDARTKTEMALAMWLEYEAGNLTSIEAGASPEYIGIGAATAVEEAKIMNDVATGRTTTDIAIKCLKILGGVALFLLLGYLGLVVAASVGGFAATALLSVFGTSTIACIASMAICLALLWGMSQSWVDATVFIMEKAGKVFDYVVEKLRESVFPKIKEITSKFFSWLKAKLGGSQSSNEITTAMA